MGARIAGLGVLVAAALALLAWLLLPRPTVAGSSTAVVPVAEVRAAASRAEPVMLREAASVERVEEPAPALSATAVPGAAPQAVQGSVWTVDGAGREALLPHGRIELLVRESVERPRGRSRVSADVHLGLFEVELPGQATWSVAAVHAEGLRLERPRLQAEGERWVVRVDLLAPLLLSVVDARTGHDLTGLHTLVLDRSAARPAIDTSQPSPLDSPIELRAAAPGDVWWVGARGYAWARVEPGAQRVALEPGASLAVEVVGDVQGVPLVLEVRPVGAERPELRTGWGHAARLELEGLTPGPCTVVLAPHDAAVRVQAAELAQAQVDLRAGQRSVVRLALSPLPERRRVRVSGRLAMSEAWSAGGPHLVLRGVGGTALAHSASGGRLAGLEVERVDGAWSFASDDVLPGGRYRIEELRSGFAHELEVGSDGAHGLELSVPDPVRVEIEVCDLSSGAPCPEADVTWLRPGTSGEILFWAAPWLTRGNGPGRFVARVPAWPRLEFAARGADGVVQLRALDVGDEEHATLRIELD